MSSTPSTPKPPVWLRFLATIDPTPVDRMRYEAGSVWHVPAERAAELIAAGTAELTVPPAAALRAVTEPLEPATESPTPVTADVVAEDE